MPKKQPQEQDQGGRKRTQPTEEPRSGGSYDAETGEQLQMPPEQKPAERDETIKE